MPISKIGTYWFILNVFLDSPMDYELKVGIQTLIFGYSMYSSMPTTLNSKPLDQVTHFYKEVNKLLMPT